MASAKGSNNAANSDHKCCDEPQRVFKSAPRWSLEVSLKGATKAARKKYRCCAFGNGAKQEDGRIMKSHSWSPTEPIISSPGRRHFNQHAACHGRRSEPCFDKCHLGSLLSKSHQHATSCILLREDHEGTRYRIPHHPLEMPILLHLLCKTIVLVNKTRMTDGVRVSSFVSLLTYRAAMLELANRVDPQFWRALSIHLPNLIIGVLPTPFIS